METNCLQEFPANIPLEMTIVKTAEYQAKLPAYISKLGVSVAFFGRVAGGHNGYNPLDERAT